jgi:hypothetical protein
MAKFKDTIKQDVAPSANKVIKRVKDAKKTVKDNAGDVWELTEKRDTFLIERGANSSDAHSELSFD